MLDSSASGTPGPRSDTQIVAASPPVTMLTLHANFHGSTGSRVVNGVADDVLRSAAKQVWIRLNDAVAVTHELYAAFPLAGLPLCVRHDVRDERLQIDPPNFRRRRSHLQPGQRQESTDHVVQTLSVTLQAIEQHVLAEALAGKAHGRVDARERRTQFVRDVRDELPLTRDEGFDALRHEVEIANQLADLVAAWPSVVCPRVQFAFG